MFKKILVSFLLLGIFQISQVFYGAGDNIYFITEQEVINFTANYAGVNPNTITTSTTLASLGITDTIQYMMELEGHFLLTYQSGDENGVITIGDAVALIQSKQ